MSPLQALKRALVTLLLELARVYALDLNLSRDSLDADVRKAFFCGCVEKIRDAAAQTLQWMRVLAQVK